MELATYRVSYHKVFVYMCNGLTVVQLLRFSAWQLELCVAGLLLVVPLAGRGHVAGDTRENFLL
jgi:hypothetical protein